VVLGSKRSPFFAKKKRVNAKNKNARARTRTRTRESQGGKFCCSKHGLRKENKVNVALR
jgi:hypothetical protein